MAGTIIFKISLANKLGIHVSKSPDPRILKLNLCGECTVELEKKIRDAQINLIYLKLHLHEIFWFHGVWWWEPIWASDKPPKLFSFFCKFAEILDFSYIPRVLGIRTISFCAYCSVSRWRPQKVDKRMVLEYTHGLFIT
jgi:hypothetical protein